VVYIRDFGGEHRKGVDMGTLLSCRAPDGWLIAWYIEISLLPFTHID
jgi:hypothetical protein